MKFTFENGPTITDVLAILAGLGVVVKAVYDVVTRIRDTNKDEKANAAKASDVFADTAVKTANLYREALVDISCLKAEIKQLREESRRENESLRNDLNFLKDVVAQKDREYLVLKQDLASKNEIIEKQQEALSKAERLHAKWEKGIEKLLEQMDRNQIKPDWVPFRDKDK